MKYYIQRVLLFVGGLALCVLVALGLHIIYDPAPAAWWELYYVTFPALGVLLLCAAGVLLMPGYNRQQRADYSHQGFVLEAYGFRAGRIRRAFDWMVVPRVHVTITINNWTPCRDCMAEVMYEMRTRLDVSHLFVDFYQGMVMASKSDPDRKFIFSDDDFTELADAVDKVLGRCQNDAHERQLQVV